jgi:hypothetical protein
MCELVVLDLPERREKPKRKYKKRVGAISG